MANHRKRKRRRGVKWIRWEDEFDVEPGEDWHALKREVTDIVTERLERGNVYGFPDKARWSIAWGYREKPAESGDEEDSFRRPLIWWSTKFQPLEGAIRRADDFIENVESGEYYKRYTNIDITRVAVIVLTPRAPGTE